MKSARRSSLAVVARVRHGWYRLTGRVHRVLESDQVRRTRRRAVTVRRWHVRWRQRLWLFPLAVLSVGWALFSFAVVVFRWNQAENFVTTACGDGYGTFCGGVIGFVLPLLGVAFGWTVFLLRRYALVRRWYQKLARRRPQGLVPTAGNIIGDVVGRDQLCDVLIGGLRDPVNRRPHVLVGGIGTGKTAVLVKLVSRLASKNLVPVTIRLRDAPSNGFDFQAMAKASLARQLDSRLRSDGELDRIWRQLRLDNRVVVLADGLEEALAGEEDRDTRIRLAIHQAVEEQLPLIITSRPHHPLRNMEAFIIELEPLGEGPALEYAARGPDGRSVANPALNRQRMSWLIQSAQVAHAPLYLQVIRDLDHVGQLWRIFGPEMLPTGVDGAMGQARPVDRVGLRWQLLDGWCQALISGHLYQDHVLDRNCREAVIEVLSALACVGVKRDQLEVKFTDLSGETLRWPDKNGNTCKPDHPAIWSELERRLRPGKVGHPELAVPNKGLRLAATMGAELGLVSAHKDGVRFRHSVVEAFLASRFLPVALRDKEYVDDAFNNAGREFLTALEFGFRAGPEPAGTLTQNFALGVGIPLTRRSDPPGSSAWPLLREDLIDRARKHASHDRSKYLSIYATIFDLDSRIPEIDSRVPEADPAPLLVGLRSGEARPAGDRRAPRTPPWKDLATGTLTLDRAIEEAKLLLVHRCGEAIRRVTARQALAGYADRRPGARASAVSAAAESGGAEQGGAVTATAPSRVGPTVPPVAGRPTAPSGPPTPGRPARRGPYRDFYELLCREQTYPVRLAGAQEIGVGGCAAAAELWDILSPSAGRGNSHVPLTRRDRWEDVVRADILRAWLAPMLYRSCQAESLSLDSRHRVNPRKVSTHVLDLWLERLVRMDPTDSRTRPSITLEVALAQGFRLAANTRDPHPSGISRTQALLIGKAEWALMHSRYWYSHVVLLQALTLLSLPSDPDQPLPDRGHGSDPRRQINYWLEVAGTRCAGVRRGRSQPPHPFVKAAGDLCTWALMTRRPAEYCWIDESGVASRVGSYSRERASQYSQRSWILESAGWGSLHPLAQRLLADVLLMLNLSERGGGLAGMDERMARADRWDLPPCIARDRSPLEPERTVGSAKTSEPGSNCLDDCRFRLCPYPPKGEPFYRDELGEGFCSQQIALLGSWYRLPGGAGWQKGTRDDLKVFWQKMAMRVRPEAPDLPTPTAGGEKWG